MQQSTIPVKIPTVFFVHVSNLVIYLKKNQGNQNNFEKVERIIQTRTKVPTYEIKQMEFQMLLDDELVR